MCACLWYSLLRTSSLPPLDWPLPSQFGQYDLKIEVQPKAHHRAHYETEGSRGAVKAASGGHPIVKVTHLRIFSRIWGCYCCSARNLHHFVVETPKQLRHYPNANKLGIEKHLSWHLVNRNDQNLFYRTLTLVFCSIKQNTSADVYTILGIEFPSEVMADLLSVLTWRWPCIS